MKVTVKTIKGDKKEIEISAEDKILQVQEKVEQAHGVPVDSQRLILKGKNLDSEKTVQEVGLQDGDTLILMVLKNAVLKKKEETVQPDPAPVQTQQPVPQPTPNIEQVNFDNDQTDNQNNLQAYIPTEEEQEEIIKELMDMGFTRDMVVQCLEVAGYNKEFAVQFLLNGIPESVLNEQLADNMDQSQTGSHEIQIT